MQIPTRSHPLKHRWSHPRWVAKRSNTKQGREGWWEEGTSEPPQYPGPLSPGSGAVPSHHCPWLSPGPRPALWPCLPQLSMAFLLCNMPNSFPRWTTYNTVPSGGPKVHFAASFRSQLDGHLLRGLPCPPWPKEPHQSAAITSFHCLRHRHHYRIFLFLHQFIYCFAAHCLLEYQLPDVRPCLSS